MCVAGVAVHSIIRVFLCEEKVSSEVDRVSLIFNFEHGRLQLTCTSTHH